MRKCGSADIGGYVDGTRRLCFPVALSTQSFKKVAGPRTRHAVTWSDLAPMPIVEYFGGEWGRLITRFLRLFCQAAMI